MTDINTIPPGQSYSGNLSPHLKDAGKRASDIVNTYINGVDFDTIKNSFIAIRLSDGGSDGVLYDSKQEAIKHQVHEQQCAYICLRNLIGGTNPTDMAIYLKINRDAYYKGFRLVDPDQQFGGPDIAITTKLNDFYRGAPSRG